MNENFILIFLLGLKYKRGPWTSDWMGGVSFPIGRRFCWFHISEERCTTTDPGSIDNVEILNSSGCKAHKSEQEQRGGDGFNGNDRTRHTRGLAISKHKKHKNTETQKRVKLGVKGWGTDEISNQQAKTEAKKAKSGNDSWQGTQYGDQRRHTWEGAVVSCDALHTNISGGWTGGSWPKVSTARELFLCLSSFVNLARLCWSQLFLHSCPSTIWLVYQPHNLLGPHLWR